MQSNYSTGRGAAKLLQDIYATTDNEIFCDDATDIMIRCADALYSDSEVRTLYPQLFRHFRVCSDCAAEYKVSMELARLEAAGQLERPPVMPSMPIPEPDVVYASRRTTIWDKVSAVVTRFADAITRGAKVGEDEVTLQVDSTDFIVTLIANPDPVNRELRTLYCNISSEELDEDLEDSPIWLNVTGRIEILQERALDKIGDISFAQLQLGMYDLHWTVSGQEYVISEFEIL